MNSSIGFAWDGEKGIFIGGSGDIEYQIEYLMDLDKDDQITSIEKFNSFYENKGDLGLFLSTHKIPELLSSNEIKEIDSELKPYNLKFNDIKENFYSLNLYFNDNSIAIKSKLDPNDKLKKLVEKYNIYDKKLDSKLLDYLPKKSLLALSSTLNLKNVIML